MTILIFKEIQPESLQYGIFDFDNGAVNTEDVFAAFDCRLLNGVLERARLVPDLEVSYVRSLAGNGGDKKLEIISGLKGVDLSLYLEGFLEERGSLRKTLFAENPAPLGRGLEILMRYLGDRCALATNKKAEKLLPDLAAMGYQDLFDVVVTVDGLNKKPAPDVILKALELLRAEADRSAYFGDNVSDIQAAVAAGAAPIGYIIEGIDGHEARVQILKDAGAWAVTDDYVEVIPFFERAP